METLNEINAIELGFKQFFYIKFAQKTHIKFSHIFNEDAGCTVGSGQSGQ